MTGTTDQGSRKAAFGILAQAGVDGHVKAGYPLAAKAEEAALLADWRAGAGWWRWRRSKWVNGATIESEQK